MLLNITDHIEVSQLSCIDIYDPIPTNVFGKIYRVGEVVCGTVIKNGVYYLINQGTENWEGWIADANIIPTEHPILGNLHTGFYEYLPELVTKLKQDIPPGSSIIVSGHSKGAAESLILGALMKLEGYNVIEAVVFACPRPGYEKFTNWLVKNLPGTSYRNAPYEFKSFGDPVPMMPDDPYTQPYQLTYVDMGPKDILKWIGLEWHKGPLYVAGLKELYASTKTVEKEQPKLSLYAKLVLWLKTLIKKM